MAKIVKAGFSRVVEPPPKVSNAPVSESAVLESAEIGTEEFAENFDTDPDLVNKLDEIEPAPLPMENYQAAYDELIIAAQDEVAALLSDARNEALTIMNDAESKSSELRDQAWDEGYAAALSQAKEEVAEIISRANQNADEMSKQISLERERYLQDLERQMLGVALDVAGNILNKELDGDDTAYVSMLREAVSKMPAEDTVSIRLHPDEYERFFKSKETKLQTPKGNISAKLIPDPTLDRYGAIIESPGGIIDAGANTQLEQMKRNFGV